MSEKSNMSLRQHCFSKLCYFLQIVFFQVIQRGATRSPDFPSGFCFGCLQGLPAAGNLFIETMLEKKEQQQKTCLIN